MNRSETGHGRWWMAGALIVALGLGGAIWQVGIAADDRDTQADQAALAQAKGLSRAFRAAAQKVLPTVVKIHTTTKPRVRGDRRGGGPQENPFRGTPFEDYFDEGRMPDFQFHQQVPQRQGVGSGVIIDSSGTILTNNHVVEGADEVIVELADGRQFKAVDIRRDELSDLAVVQIEAGEKLPSAKLGDSSKMGIGDWVLSIGSPFDLDSTVSAGIISGKGRQLPSGKRTEFLQTDAMINPGNSGGPLVNLDGEVIGINTAIASDNGAFQGIGFAIPSNLAKWVTGQLIKSGKVQRAYLGVEMDEINARLAAKLGVAYGRGVLIKAVVPRSPAAKAGLEPGDVIVAFAGQPVRGFRALQEVVEQSAAGSQQTIDIVRDGKPKSLKVTVTPLPTELPLAGGPRLQRSDQPEDEGFTSEELGLRVGQLNDRLAKQLGYEGQQGVLVTEVDPEGISASAGIRPGTLISQVGRNKKVSSVAEFKAALKGESLEKKILLVIHTANGAKWLVLQR